MCPYIHTPIHTYTYTIINIYIRIYIHTNINHFVNQNNVYVLLSGKGMAMICDTNQVL